MPRGITVQRRRQLIEEIGQVVWYCGHVPLPLPLRVVLAQPATPVTQPSAHLFIESRTYLKEFRKIPSTNDARTNNPPLKRDNGAEKTALNAAPPSSQMKKTVACTQIN
ncbi:MAG: hypothetical protein IPM88_06060 [Nitrospira sp.]|nr:hypothetical protein [Nitrospira sp.]